jgi:hypothetical protein
MGDGAKPALWRSTLLRSRAWLRQPAERSLHNQAASSSSRHQFASHHTSKQMPVKNETNFTYEIRGEGLHCYPPRALGIQLQNHTLPNTSHSRQKQIPAKNTHLDEWQQRQPCTCCLAASVFFNVSKLLQRDTSG